MPPTSISSTTSSAAQYGLQQLKLQQAQRNANQAEQAARALEAQASSAKQEAQQAQDRARSLEIQSGVANTVAGQARQGVAAVKTADQMQVNLGNTLDQAIQKLDTSTTTNAIGSTSTSMVTSATNENASSPVVNTQGETTGTIINTTA